MMNFNDAPQQQYDKPITAAQVMPFIPKIPTENLDYEDDYEANENVRVIVPKTYSGRKLSDIPPREWLYGNFLIRNYVSLIIAAGGLGKSSLALGEAVAMASHKNLFDVWTGPKAHRVWYWNLEDTQDELDLRIGAILKYHGVSFDDLGGRLKISSRDDPPMCVAKAVRGDATIQEAEFKALEAAVKLQKIDALIIDPFVSAHSVNENDNGAIDAIAKRFSRLAGRTNCAVCLVHHTKKTTSEITAESSRGAGALIGAARNVRVLNPMSENEANLLGADADKRRSYFRVQSDKANLAPLEGAAWYTFKALEADNGTFERPAGDSVGVVSRWYPKPPLNDISNDSILEALERLSQEDGRHNPQAENWAGHLIAEIVGINTKNKSGLANMKRLLKELEQSGQIKKFTKPSESDKGKKRPFYKVTAS